MNQKLPDVKTGFWKGRGTRDQTANIHRIMKKPMNSRKTSALLTTLKPDCVDYNKLWKILKEMGIPDHLTCLLRNLYAGQEATDLDMEQWTGSKLGRSMTRLYIVTLLILLLCRVHHEKCWAGWVTSYNQDCREKYQQPQIGRSHHSNGRKWRGTKELLDESERGEWKNWLKTQHSKN